nr:S-layer homology domain-containing protein [bacterium]
MVFSQLRAALCVICLLCLHGAAVFAQDNLPPGEEALPADETYTVLEETSDGIPMLPEDEYVADEPAADADSDVIEEGAEEYIEEEYYDDPAETGSGPSFNDVPEHHWSYEALDYLQDAGLVEGYPDNTFRGDRPFSRYEMAMVVARIFTKLEDWQSMGGVGTSAPTTSEIDMQEVYARLDRLAGEFRDELDALGARMTAVEDEQTRMRGEMNNIRALIKESGLSGTARWRVGTFMGTGSGDVASEVGFEQEIRLNYKFAVDEGTDFHLSMTSYENEGPVADGVKPGNNNETPFANPSPLPAILRRNASSFIVDEAFVEYCWDGAFGGLLGDIPVLTIGRHYFSEGEFGLAGDNGYRSTLGARVDFALGKELDAYAAFYRPDSVESFAPFKAGTNQFGSSAVTKNGDDMLMAGIEYHSGEATIPGHNYKFAVRGDFVPNGFGQENYFSISGNAEVPWFGSAWLNGLRGEMVMLSQNSAGQDPEALGLTASSFILELDVYNTEDTRFTVAFAQLGQVEAMPAFANVDNDPFSEWDFTLNEVGDSFNFSREGRGWFPQDFNGFGIQAEHRFGGNLHALLSYY